MIRHFRLPIYALLGLIVTFTTPGCAALDSFLKTDAPCVLPSLGAMANAGMTCNATRTDKTQIGACILQSLTTASGVTLCELAAHHVMGQHDPGDPYDTTKAPMGQKRNMTMTTPPKGFPIQVNINGRVEAAQCFERGTVRDGKLLLMRDGTLSAIVPRAIGNAVEHALTYDARLSAPRTWCRLEDDADLGALEAKLSAPPPVALTPDVVNTMIQSAVKSALAGQTAAPAPAPAPATVKVPA